MENQNQQPQQQQQLQPQDLAAAPGAPALSCEPTDPMIVEPNEHLMKLMLMQQQAQEGHA